MLHVHFSNRIERLRARLLQQLDSGAGDVFAAEQIIVPSAALRRHLSLAIADAHGICANVEFGFLAQWLWRQIARVVAGVGAESPFAATRLVWRVHAAFGDAAFVAAQPRLAAYLEDGDPLLRWELAQQVAALLEQYVTYRADWLRVWRDGGTDAAGDAAPHDGDAAWQAALWQRIDAELGMHALHPAQVFADTLRRGGPALARQAGLPRSAHLFALPGMAPLHLQLLQALSQVMELHLYVPNPCEAFWFDLVDARRLRYLAARGRAQGLEEAPPLLVSWGRQAQAQIESLVAAGGDGVEDDADFEPTPGTHLLARLQNALLDMQTLAPGSIRLAADDRSIELHVCHSLTRELEVLQDHLLGLFAQDRTLRPGDVLVALPDLEAAAPLIDAVFGTVPRERALPYAVCGSAGGAAGQGSDAPARCLRSLLALVGSRCTASEVFGLLQQPLVARRFGLDEDTLAQLHAALREAGFHWALDARQRAVHGLPETEAHTLDDALQRLFLGYALPAQQGQPFVQRLGAGGIEGSAALALGALWRYAQSLQRLRDDLLQPKRPEDWALALNRALDDFMAPEGAALDELRALRQTVQQLVDDMRGGGVDDALPLPVLRAALQARLDDPARGGAAGGSINFASLNALRGLPFRVVCLIGLDDGAFPSVRRAAEFDLMARQPRRGDRNRRDDERGLMLDLLLAARDSLYLSHTGRSVRDNAALPPSVLVSELLDLLLPAIADDPGSAASLAAARARLVVEHPLQAFAQVAFRVDADPRLRSHDRELAAALRAGLRAALPAADAELRDDEAEAADDATVHELQAPFFGGPLPSPGPEWRELSLDTLAAFLRNPCRALLRRRLDIALPLAEDELEDDEPLRADSRALRRVAQRLLPALRDGADLSTLRSLAQAGVELPGGPFGDVQLDEELLRLLGYQRRLDAAAVGDPLPPQTLDLAWDIDGERWRLQAVLGALRPPGQVGGRYGDAGAADHLQAWLQHLALCALAPGGVARRTHWVARDGAFGFDPVADAAARLRELVALYRRGLCEPLRFFPRSAWALLTQSEAAARSTWQRYGGGGEHDDAAYRLALRGVEEPLDAGFVALAHTVYDPLLEHLAEVAA